MQMVSQIEEWRDIPGYNGSYRASNLGNILSLVGSPKILKPFINNMGYRVVTLSGSKCLVHRLVALAFLDNPNKYTVVHHIDDNPLNCRADNLKWCTQSHNQLYSKKRLGENAYCAKIDGATAWVIFSLSKNSTPLEISNYLKVPYNIVYKIICGAAWNHITCLPRKRYYKLKTAA